MKRETILLHWCGGCGDKHKAQRLTFTTKKAAKEYIKEERRRIAMYGSELMGMANYFEMI